MTPVLEAQGLGKRYRRRWALSDCTLAIPAGRVTGLVGPNGAGKTTLLNLAVGLLAPTTGSVQVLGGTPSGSSEQLAKVGFVAQDAPVYSGLSVADHLRLGAHLNPGWDAGVAERRIAGLGLDCAAHGDCGTLASAFIAVNRHGIDEVLYFLGIALIYAVPALIGLFWGAPLLAREIESGTFRLAWTQSVARTRWILVKLGVIGLCAMVTAGLLSLMVGWWAEPVYKAAAVSGRPDFLGLNRFSPAQFDVHAIAPIGYAAFAFMLGVTAGVLIRRTVPAMATALASFAFVQLAWPNWIRQHLMTPVHGTAPLRAGDLAELLIVQDGRVVVTGAAAKPGAWILSNQTIAHGGQAFSGPAPAPCLHAGPQACNTAIGALHLRQLLTYQPADRFWTFQWYETGLYLVLALALAWFCAWRISRRRLA